MTTDQAKPTEQEPSRCIWQSSNETVLKLWKTECGNAYEGLRELCPSCGLRVFLTGFDAWWEARKSYHP